MIFKDFVLGIFLFFCLLLFLIFILFLYVFVPPPFFHKSLCLGCEYDTMVCLRCKYDIGGFEVWM